MSNKEFAQLVAEKAAAYNSAYGKLLATKKTKLATITKITQSSDSTEAKVASIKELQEASHG